MSAASPGPLSGRVALVTGGATGLGRAIAERFGRDGAAVMINHPRTPEKAGEVVADLRAKGIAADEVGADISIRAEFAEAVAKTKQVFGGWDILVANAALTTTQPLVAFDEATIDALLAVNIKGVIWGLQLAAAELAENGRVINVGSSTTGLMLPGYAVYDATKAAMEQLTRIGAHELGARGITVNVIAPGATATETYAAGRGEALVARFAGMSAFGRLGTPAEIADVAAFLAGQDSRWITGQVLRVNGGTV
jgi:3-oxoacyl-[acyl-carrier protein] reductase